ncbi:hypothetical protein HUF15_39025, partial [Streptomyces samsunensis]|uniref:SDR family NAD(P)-dependent oxidoreductase n=1 Tax=Streptomyces malaysiensis TaxID=92644 RepID=UPI00158401F8|nr:hypothetical protein [Streptomyces samsunensis]
MAKTIAVFGAGSGMGKAVARRFGQEGYRIALVARRREPLTTPRSARQLVHHVLPEMLERGDGGILFAYGSSVMFPAGGVSGPVPLMAAARNYILTLHEELAGRGVYAGGLAVRALIAQSQASQAVKAGEMKLNMELPVVEPHELADLEWELLRARNQADVLYPKTGKLGRFSCVGAAGQGDGHGHGRLASDASFGLVVGVGRQGALDASRAGA